MRDVQRGMDVYWDDRIAAIILVAVIEKKDVTITVIKRIKQNRNNCNQNLLL